MSERHPHTLSVRASRRARVRSREWENWPLLSPSTALCTAGPVPGLGSREQLVLVLENAGEPPRGCENRRAGRLTSSDTAQAKTQGFELAYHNVYPINELLESMKGQILQIQKYTTTQGNSRTSNSSPTEVPALIEQQKPEALY